MSLSTMTLAPFAQARSSALAARARRFGPLAFAMGLASSLAACVTLPDAHEPSEVPLVSSVDLVKFQGDWFVQGNIPTYPERHAYNPVENYKLNENGEMATTFTMQDGSFDAPVKTYTPTGFPVPESHNALWGMQFIWPFKAEYRIAYLDPEYQTTIIARTKKDYVWLMTRKPEMSDADYQRYAQMIAGWGYDISKLRRVPQQPSGQRKDGH